MMSESRFSKELNQDDIDQARYVSIWNEVAENSKAILEYEGDELVLTFYYKNIYETDRFASTIHAGQWFNDCISEITARLMNK